MKKKDYTNFSTCWVNYNVRIIRIRSKEVSPET